MLHLQSAGGQLLPEGSILLHMMLLLLLQCGRCRLLRSTLAMSSSSSSSLPPSSSSAIFNGADGDRSIRVRPRVAAAGRRWRSSSSSSRGSHGRTLVTDAATAAAATATTNANTATLRLYRVLQRQCQEMATQLLPDEQHHNCVLLQPPLDPHRAGNARIFPSLGDASVAALLRFFIMYLESSNYTHDNDATNNVTDALDDWLEQVDTVSMDGTNEPDWQDDADLETIWARPRTMQAAIRHAFRSSTRTRTTTTTTTNAPTMDDVTRLHHLAIQCYKLLNEQQQLRRTQSISTSHHVRVVATSRCIGRSLGSTASSSSSAAPADDDDGAAFARLKVRFAYRIRVENRHNQDHVQLLGRTWNIQESLDQLSPHELSPLSPSSSSPPPPSSSPLPPPIVVDAPQTGAVGKLPVLAPGECFEYMSGCELATRQGRMWGTFHLATVPAGTPSAVVGQPVPALGSDAARFQVPVAPFLLLDHYD